MLLECNNVVKKYLKKRALDGLTLQLETGKIYGLLGPNGSGKSTWMKVVDGLSVIDDGSILFEGEPIGTKTKSEIAFMPAEDYYYSYMKIKDVEKYYIDFFEDFQPDTFQTLLQKMQLDPSLKVKTLSTGMLAKLKVAVTLSRNAKLVLLDEPLNGIDLLARQGIESIIRDFLRTGRCVVMSSHLVEEMEPLIDEAVFVKDGKVVHQCSAQEFRDPDQPGLVELYTKIFGGVQA